MKPILFNLSNFLRSGVFAATLAGAALPGYASDESPGSAEPSRYLPWEKGSVALGGFAATFSSDLTFGINDSSVSAEDVLGLGSSLTVFRLGAMYRPGKTRRHQFDISYASYHRSGGGSLSKEIEIAGEVYPIGADVSSYLDFDIIRGTYSYAVVQSERVRIGLGLGIYAVPLAYGLEVQTAGGINAVEGADITLPLPALALRSEFQVVPKLFLNASIEAMYLEISDFKGSLLDFNVGAEYRPWKHFGIGAAYSGMFVEVETEASSSDYPGANFVGSVDIGFTGLLLYGKWSF